MVRGPPPRHYLTSLPPRPESRQLVPGARLTEYPPIFPDRGSNTGPCKIADRYGFTIALSAARERQMLLQQQLNSAITRAANSIRTGFRGGDIYPVDVTSHWGGYLFGHTIDCGDKGRAKPWVNAVRTDNWPTGPMRGGVQGFKKWWLSSAKEVSAQAPGSFHPTVQGQAAMAKATFATLDLTAPTPTPPPPPAPLTVTTASLPAAEAGQSYTATLSAAGGRGLRAGVGS